MPIEIKNLLFQPLCLHLAGDGSKSLHLNPREKRLIQPEEVSEEIRRAEKRGSIALTDTGSRPIHEAPALRLGRAVLPYRPWRGCPQGCAAQHPPRHSLDRGNQS